MSHIIVSPFTGELPTKPFGVPYPCAVIYDKQKKCVLADSPEELMLAWTPDYLSLSPKERKVTLLALARSVTSQLQAAVIEKLDTDTLASLTEEERDALSWDHTDPFPVQAWTRPFPLFLVDSPASQGVQGEQVRRFHAGNVESFIRSLQECGVIEVALGDFSYRRGNLALTSIL